MSEYSFSPSQLAFYANALKETFYQPAGQWPDDAFAVPDAVTAEFTAQPPAGKRLGCEAGLPAWEDTPPPTQEQAIAAAEAERQRLIDAANDFINSRQWPGKAAIGRLKGDELAQYNIWLDYLDDVEALDVSGAPDIQWTEKPAQ